MIEIVDKTLRVDDRYGERREGESTSSWQSREEAWKGAPSQQAVKAGQDEQFEFGMKRHNERVEAARQAKEAEAAAARPAELKEARAFHEKHKARQEEDALIAAFRAQKNRAPGRV